MRARSRYSYTLRMHHFLQIASPFTKSRLELSHPRFVIANRQPCPSLSALHLRRHLLTLKTRSIKHLPRAFDSPALPQTIHRTFLLHQRMMLWDQSINLEWDGWGTSSRIRGRGDLVASPTGDPQHLLNRRARRLRSTKPPRELLPRPNLARRVPLHSETDRIHLVHMVEGGPGVGPQGYEPAHRLLQCAQESPRPLLAPLRRHRRNRINTM